VLEEKRKKKERKKERKGEKKRRCLVSVAREEKRQWE
jgi:hypothetical protein